MRTIRTRLTVLLVAGAVAGGALVAGIAPGGGGGGSFTCDSTLSTGANIATAVSSAPAGTTICLTAGSYTGFNYPATTVNKSSMTTVRGAPGTTASQVVVTGGIWFGTSSHIRFQGMTVAGGGDAIGALTSDIEFVGDRFTDQMCLNSAMLASADSVLIQGSTFSSYANHLVSGCGEGRLMISGNNGSQYQDSGIVIDGNTFGGQGGCMDGIQINGGGTGVDITNNTFSNIQQNSPLVCASVNGAHVDPIQFYGAAATVIRGNYFTINSTGILSSDGNGDDAVIDNNVFGTNDGYFAAIVDCGGDNQTITHNTFQAGGGQYDPCKTSVGDTTSATVVRDNYIADGFSPTSQTTQTAYFGVTADHNMCPSGSGGGYGCNNGAGAVTGSATYVGGASPSVFSGFFLAPATPGYLGASDGLSIGVH